MTAAIYVTVDYFDVARRNVPRCDGCTPPNVPPDGWEPSAMRVIGASGGMNLCTRCARDIIKSIAARFMLHDPRSTRDLLDFFGASDAKRSPPPPPPRRPRRKPTGEDRMIAAPAGVVEVLPPGTVPKSAKKPKVT